MDRDHVVISMGTHVLDVLARPVEEIPAGQGGALVEEIRITAAGAAGGTAVTLAKLGARVRSAGAIGTDAVGDMLVMLLQRSGVDTSLLVRRDHEQTSASVLPIRPNGDRPAFHVIGANATYGLDDVDWTALDGASHLHIGGPEMLAGGGSTAAALLVAAKERGLSTSADLLTPGEFLPLVAESLEPVWAHLDYLLPNDDQITGLVGTSDIADSCRAMVERGVGCVAATCGAAGAVVADRDGLARIPAYEVAVVDTTGCGDSFSAGFIRGRMLGRGSREAAVLGCATAGWVAQGLGTDHGDFDLAAVDELARSTAFRAAPH